MSATDVTASVLFGLVHCLLRGALAGLASSTVLVALVRVLA